MSKVGQLMEDHFNHENESDSGDSKEASSDDDIDSSDTDSSDSDSDSNSDDEKKKRKKKSTHSKKRKAKKSKKTKSKKKKKKNIRTAGKYGKHLKPTDTCPIHGGHKWAKCRLNNHGDSYDPPRSYGTYDNTNHQAQGYHGGQNAHKGHNHQSRGRNNQSQGQGQRNQGQQYYNEEQQQVGESHFNTPSGAPIVQPSINWNPHVTPIHSLYDPGSHHP